ncbi:MAG: patatin-like phospholipase family protein, partial [Candidatus Omnitrophota bacterium]
EFRTLAQVRRISFFIVLAIFFLSAPSLWAQELPGFSKINRPKIGLVLGGGGARGAAHVGVLKVLEVNHVPIDFIVGTSMGSIVGGLYAAGYSPDEIEELFNKIDWNEMLSDRPTEDVLPFRNKKDFQRLSNLEMGIKNGKILFPRGIIAGQKLDFMLNKLTIHTVDLKNFDQLRIPFRAVATDVVTGQMVVFDKGNLAEAIRASMSVPGAFPPVKVGNRLLIDGFVAKNVPVEIAKEWGADIIIAVDVGAELLKESELKTLIDITSQMFNILSQKNVDESLKLLTDKDLLIRPELQGIGQGDFVKTPEAAKCGEKSALNHVEEIQRYSVSDKEYQTFLVHQRVREQNPIMIDFVEVTKPKRVNEQLVKGQIKTKPGKPLDFDQLERDLTNVYAIGDFETVGFNIEEQNGKKGLVFNTQEKSWGPEYLRFGFNLQSDIGTSNNYTTILDYRHTQLNSLGGEWKVVGQIGQNSGVFTDFYQPLDAQNYFFIDPQLFYGKNLQDIYSGNKKTTQYKKTEGGGGFDLGVNLKSYVEARIGLRRSVINAEPEIGTDQPSFSNVQKGGVLAQIDFDQLDDHRFPTHGIKAETNLFLSEAGLGADQSYQKLDLGLAKATTAGRHTIVAALKGGMSLDDKTPYYDQFSLGGFMNLSGLAQDQLRGKNMGVGELVYYYKLVETTGFANKIYIGGSFEAGNVWEDKKNFGKDLIYSGSAFVGLDTILGPLYIGYGMADGYSGRAFVYLGKTF